MRDKVTTCYICDAVPTIAPADSEAGLPHLCRLCWTELHGDVPAPRTYASSWPRPR